MTISRLTRAEHKCPLLSKVIEMWMTVFKKWHRGKNFNQDEAKQSRKPKIMQRGIEFMWNSVQSLLILSAMAMAMSIYWTLCVLDDKNLVFMHVDFKIFSP